MKKVFLLSLMMISSSVIFAQTLKDVVSPETQITWLGLDFSLVKVVADQDAWVYKTPGQLFKAWNDLMINEQKKFNIAEALNRDHVKFSLDVTIDHNATRTTDNLFIQQASPDALPKIEEVASVVKSYDYKGNAGIGFMLIAESFDKPAEQASWWITFINMETKEIVYIQKMTASAVGFGLRNYWANTVYNILKKIESSEFKKWRRSVK